MGFRRGGWKSPSVPSGGQLHFPLRAPCPKPKKGPRAHEGASATGRSCLSRGARGGEKHERPARQPTSEPGRRTGRGCRTPPRRLGLARRARARVGVGGRGAPSSRRARATSGASPAGRPARLGPGARHEGRAAGGWGEGGGAADRRGPSGGRARARAGEGGCGPGGGGRRWWRWR